VRAVSGVGASGHVVERSAVLVDEGVEETKGRLASSDTSVVDEGEDASGDGAGGGGTGNAGEAAARDDAVGVDLAGECCDVRVATASIVPELLWGEGACGLGLVARNGVGLVGGDAEGVGEATAAGLPCGFVADGGACSEVGAANDGDVGAASGEVGVEGFVL